MRTQSINVCQIDIAPNGFVNKHNKKKFFASKFKSLRSLLRSWTRGTIQQVTVKLLFFLSKMIQPQVFFLSDNIQMHIKRLFIFKYHDSMVSQRDFYFLAAQSNYESDKSLSSTFVRTCRDFALNFVIMTHVDSWQRVGPIKFKNTKLKQE